MTSRRRTSRRSASRRRTSRRRVSLARNAAVHAIDVKVHPKIIDLGGDQTVRYFIKTEGARVRVSRREDASYGTQIPRESLKHFINDLAGKVDVPRSENPYIDAVATGRAELLGKGDDGIAFRVGDHVVKVSTTVPYQPDNPGHRTPPEASNMLRQQTRLGNAVADLGVPVLRSEFVKHGAKGFQIKPYVEIPEKWSRARLDEIQAALHEMHERGYTMNDNIQAGLLDGRVVFFDTGKMGKTQSYRGEPDLESDLSSLKHLYRENGERFVNIKDSEALKMWTRLETELLTEIPENFGFARYQFAEAEKMRQEEAHASLTGKALENALRKISWDVRHIHGEINRLEKRI